MPIRAQRRPLALAAAVATAAALGATALTATTASAAEVPLSGYELTWGIKQSYRTYITGMAAGTFTPADGASQAADNGPFTFVDGTGTYDSTAHTLALGFQGSLKISSPAHRFEFTLSDVRFDSADAEITADVTKDGTTTQDVPLADVTVTRSMTDMATTLTEEAADVFGSAGYAGAAGDPLTVVQKQETHSPTPTPTATQTETESPEPTATPSATPSTTPSATPSASASTSPSPSAEPSTEPSPAPAVGDIVDGTLGWGVKQSFRTYVMDGVAKGKITTSGGASQAANNGAFTFVDATGAYDTDKDTLSAAFKGAVNFKGHEENGEYGLDLTLTGLEVNLDGGTGELTADVTSLGKTSKDVVLAELDADTDDLKAKDDVITLDDVKATLTAAGAEAFGGFYSAGAELDPVDVRVALSEDADLPGGGGDDDSGQGTSGGTGGSGSAGGTGSTTGGVTGGLAATGSDVPVAALGTAAALTVAAGAGVVFAMRRRRTQA